MTDVPPRIQPLLNDYCARLSAELPNMVMGIYVYGSIALAAFHPVFSDIDFLTVLNRPCTEDELGKLRQIHHTIARQYPVPPMEGGYLVASDLGKLPPDLAPYPCYMEGNFHPSSYRDANYVTWWLLKNKGVTLRGTPAQDLPYSVDWDALIADMHQNMNTYWIRFTREPKVTVRLVADSAVQWAVLGVLRQFYTFRENDITSKTGAGEYALRHLPAKWHRIIQEALRIRNQSGKSLYRFRLRRLWDTVQFVKMVIRKSNAEWKH